MRPAIGVAAILAGCASQSSNGLSTLATQRQEARRIAQVCGLPKETLIVRDDGSLRLRPAPTESYEKVDCALARLRESGLLLRLPTGFVGNERYDENLQ